MQVEKPGMDSCGTGPIDWAVVKTGGKQYRVHVGDLLTIERSKSLVKSKNRGDDRWLVEFKTPLVLYSKGSLTTDPTTLRNACVKAEVVEDGKAPKVTVFKKRRRKNSRQKIGHRQACLQVRILDICEDGKTQSSDERVLREEPMQPVEKEDTAHDDFISAISALRIANKDDAPLHWLGRIVNTDWSEAPEWSKRDISHSIRRFIDHHEFNVRAHAAAALHSVLEGRVEGALDWSKIAETVNRYLESTAKLEVFVRMSVDEVRVLGSAEKGGSARYSVSVQVLNEVELPEYTRIRLKTTGVIARRLTPQVRGANIVAGSASIKEISCQSQNVARNWVLAFDTLEEEQSGRGVIVDVCVSGQRIDRRFISLSTHTISHSPQPFNQRAEAAM